MAMITTIVLSVGSVEAISPHLEVDNLSVEVMEAFDMLIAEINIEVDRLDARMDSLNATEISEQIEQDGMQIDIGELQSDVTFLESQTAKISKFKSPFNVGVSRTMEPAQMVGFDGTITKLIYSLKLGSNIAPVTVTLSINSVDTLFTCQIVPVANTVVTCSKTGSVPVDEFDVLSIRENQSVFNQLSGTAFASVFIEPTP